MGRASPAAMTFIRDARLGIRLLWRQPGFTVIALLTLALGIAANTAIFTVVYATLLAPLPYEHGDRIVMVWSRVQNNRNGSAAGTYEEWKRRARSFDGLAAWTGRQVSLAEPGQRPDQVQARLGTPGFITIHGFKMMLGRDFVPEEGVTGKDQAIVLPNRFWRTRYNSDASIVGKTVRVDGMPYNVVGVLAPGVADRLESDLFLPLAFKPDQLNHDFHWLLVMGRLKANVTVAQADAEMKGIAAQIAKEFPKSKGGWSASVEPLKNNFLPDDMIATLWLLLGSVGFVLLIACANIANLLLARGTARQREMAVRASLGASRGRLFAQMLTESVILAAAGGLLGLVLAFLGMDALLAVIPPNTLPSEADMTVNVPVLLFTLAVSLLSGVLFGSAPAWQIKRINLNDVLKETGRSNIGGGRHFVRRVFVVTEFALALTLLAGAGLAISSLVKLANVDLGFKTERLLTMSLPVPDTRLKGAEQIEMFYRQVIEQARALPGVSSVSVSTGFPVRGTNFGMPFTIVGRPVSDPGQRPGAGFNMVTTDYFKTFGIPIQRGRAFTEQDSAAAPRVAIVNDAFVRQYLTGLDPLNTRILVEQLLPGETRLGEAVEWQIVGVYRAVRNRGPRGDFPEIDVPFAQSPWPGASIGLRTTSPDPESVRNAMAAIVQKLDPDLPIADVRTMEQLLYERLAFDRFQAVLFGAFAGVALVLAALGIYGVMSFTVVQRTHEIGLRMALGAGRDQVLRQILRQGLATALVGIAIGSVGAYLVGRGMRGMLFGVDAIDPLAFSIVAGLLLGASILACFIPAMRAASVDPMTALRDG
jgi:putative ABC transport system permease protein